MTFTYNRTIRFQDTDAAGVVYFANILAICHEAYEDSLAASGIELKSFFTNLSIAIPIIHTSANFFRPMFCGDEIIVELVPQQLSSNKFTINYQIFNPTTDELVAKATTNHVCIDATNRTKKDLSDELIKWLQL